MKRGNHNAAVGKAGEAEAARYLTGLGYTVLERNVRFRHGEIDLVTRDGQTVVFVEVKTRTSDQFGTAAEAVTRAKQRQLALLASLYLSVHGLSAASCRFDVVTVEPADGGGWRCNLIRNAFET